jgi:hypothetical protein
VSSPSYVDGATQVAGEAVEMSGDSRRRTQRRAARRRPGGARSGADDVGLDCLQPAEVEMAILISRRQTVTSASLETTAFA